MPIEMLEDVGGKIAHVRLSGRLSTEDYERYLPHLDRLIQQHGKIRVLAELHDYQGLDMGAWWEDTKFGMRHIRDVERVAAVGGPKWWDVMAKLCAPFLRSRCFEHGQEEEARRWIESDEE
jgi:hypothetical protein